MPLIFQTVIVLGKKLDSLVMKMASALREVAVNSLDSRRTETMMELMTHKTRVRTLTGMDAGCVEDKYENEQVMSDLNSFEHSQTGSNTSVEMFRNSYGWLKCHAAWTTLESEIEQD